MVRKLVRTLVSLSLATPLSVWGLGLGDIHLYSALNEKLDAKIELLSVEEGDLESIEVGLASYDAFERVGIERTGALALLDFAVEKGSNGKAHVLVTSKQAVREPFLDFLVDVEWRYGKLLREYTLLLDPPEMSKGRTPHTAPPVAAPRESSRTSKKVENTYRKERTFKKESATAGGRGEGEALVHGPVQANETLWAIAKRLRKNSGVSINQMMIALFRANRHAFIDDNINKLRKGVILRLDDPALARELKQADATREVIRQAKAWDRMKQSLTKQSARGSQQREPAPASSVATRKGGKLKLVAPEGKASEAGGTSESGDANLEAVRKELMLAQEAEEAQRRENDELRERLQELEGQLISMQRLLVLEGNDMAQLQGQLAEGNAEKAMPAEKAIDQKPSGNPEGEVAAARQAAEKPPKPKEKAKPQPEAKSKPSPEPEPVWVRLLDEILSNPYTKNLSDPYTVGGLGIGIVLLGLLAIVIRRRMNGGYQESILTGGTSSMLNPKGEGNSSMETSLLSDLANDGMGGMSAEDSEVDPIAEADVYMAYGRHQQAEELLKDAIEQEPERHELLVKLMEIYHKTKNKKAFLTQADAAHSALEGSGALWDKIAAMGHELAPDNNLFAKAPGNPAPNEPAEEPAASVDEVLDIGLDLDALAADMEPSEEYSSVDTAAGDSKDNSDWDLDLGVDISEPDDELPKDQAGSGDTEPEEESEQAAVDFEGLDFGFDSEGESPSQAPEEGGIESWEDENGEQDFGVEDSEPTREEASAGSDSEDNGLDFNIEDFDLPEEQSEASVPSEEVKHEEGAVMDFDLGDFKLPDEDDATEPESAANEIPSVGAPEVDDASEETVLDFGFELDDQQSESTDEGQSDLGFDLDEEFGGGIDEVGTKLDLATAYVEMGDAGGARDMLEEVLREGSTEQQQKAQQLLEQISA